MTKLFPLLVVNFIGTVGFSLVLPFLVFLVTDWGGNAFVYGVAGATYSSFQLVGAPVLGRWSDRYGRRKILLLSQAGTLVSWLVFLTAFGLPRTELFHFDSSVSGAFVVTLPLVVLLLARAMDGLTGGNVSIANAYVADITSEDQRATSFGQMAVSSNLGFVLGPAMAGMLGATAWGALLPVMAAAAISLLATLLIAFRLPDVRPCGLTRNPEQPTVRKQFGQEHRDCYAVEDAPALTFAWLRYRPGLLALLVTYFLVMLAFNFFYVTFPVFAVGVLGWLIRDTGLFFAVMGLLMVVVPRSVLPVDHEPGIGTRPGHHRQPCAGDGFLAVRLSNRAVHLRGARADGGRQRGDVAIGAVAAVESGLHDLPGGRSGDRR